MSFAKWWPIYLVLHLLRGFLFFKGMCIHCLPEGKQNIASETQTELGQQTPIGIKPNKLWAANWGQYDVINTGDYLMIQGHP